MFLSKVIKLRKVVIGAMNLKTRIQKYCGKAHDNGYTVALVHASTVEDGSNSKRKSQANKDQKDGFSA